MATGIIAPLKKGVGDRGTLYGSLLEAGYHRAPGASLTLFPKQEANGSYRTGLDENADYIKSLPKEEQDIEKARVRSWKEICEQYYKVDLSPTSKFYTDMFLGKKDQFYCPKYKMHPKEEMIFDLDNPTDLIVFAYLRVRDDFVAPTYDSYQLGLVLDPMKCVYYVKDEQTEASVSYKKNAEMNKAIATLDNSSTTKQRSTARCLGLGISDNTSPEVVYNLLNDYIKQGVLEEGYYKGKKAVELFNSFMTMKDENLKIYDEVTKAIEYNIYRYDELVGVKKGTRVLGKNKEEVVIYLLTTNGQDDLLALKAEIEQKEAIPSKKTKK